MGDSQFTSKPTNHLFSIDGEPVLSPVASTSADEFSESVMSTLGTNLTDIDEDGKIQYESTAERTSRIRTSCTRWLNNTCMNILKDH